MRILKFIKGMWPDTEPKPLAVLEKAETRCKAPHGFLKVRLNLQRQVKSIKGYVEENENHRIEVVWDALGAAYTKGSRARKYDLLITEPYVC
jgi:hypothetical protein